VTPDTVIDGENSTQGWNRYTYCHNNPIMYRDPTGHAKDEIKTAVNNATSLNPVKATMTNSGIASFDKAPKMFNANTDKAIQAHSNKMSQMAKGNYNAVSPSTNKGGVAIITDCYPNYAKGGYHGGIDIRAGTGDKTVAPEDVLITNTNKTNGIIEMKGLKSGNNIKYVHQDPEKGIESGKKILKGHAVGEPAKKLTDTLHLHMEVRDKSNNPIAPDEYLIKQNPDLKFEFKNKEIEKYYRDNRSDLLNKYPDNFKK